MAFRFKRSSCVAAGTFNMYIVQPPWLARIGIIPKGIQVAIGSKLDEPGFRFFAPDLRSRWYVTPTRIEVESDNAMENCGNLVAAVVEKLPWTPLKGIGNNTIYEGALTDLPHVPESLRRFEPTVPTGYEMRQRSLHVSVIRDGRHTNLQVSVLRDKLELSVNVHTELGDRDSEIARQAALRFVEDREAAKMLIKTLFQLDLDDGSDTRSP